MTLSACVAGDQAGHPPRPALPDALPAESGGTRHQRFQSHSPYQAADAHVTGRPVATSS